MTYLVFALGGVVVVLCWGWYHLALQNGRLALRLERVELALRDAEALAKTSEELGIEGITPGQRMRDFALPVLGGGSMTLSEWSGRRVLIAFIHPECQPSRTFLSKLPPRNADDDPVVLLVSSGDLLKNEQMVAEYNITCPVILQTSNELSSLYEARSTPTGYLIDVSGRTEGPILIGESELLGAIGVKPDAATESPAKTTKSPQNSRLLRTGLKAGTPAPDFKLPELDGSELALNDFRGKRVLLVFSDPDCAPCQSLAPKLEKVHKLARDMQVLMISRGNPDANREKRDEHRLTFPIVLQRQWEISKQYGMFATPIAFLVSKDGVITHDVAVGGDSILRLAAL
jgi:peroxiredoxin